MRKEKKKNEQAAEIITAETKDFFIYDYPSH